MQTDVQLIRCLADGQCHSGALLAEKLGISRAAVWKAVQRTRAQFGLDILAEKGQGYQLNSPLELLDADAITNQLPIAAKVRIGAIRCFMQLESTNTWLLEQSTQGAAKGTVVLAERQTAGHGRRGRAWHSPFGANLYLSMLWSFETGPATLGALSLAAGAAVAQALESLGVTGIQLKWPNDIHWQARKLGGLLIEIAGETQGPSRAVIGLGLNLRMPASAAKVIDQPWVDLREICQDHTPERNLIAACCIDHLSTMLTGFLDQGPTPFLNTWRRFDAYRDQLACLHWSERRVEGIYRGIDDQGALLLQIGEDIHRFAAGELSLRPGLSS